MKRVFIAVMSFSFAFAMAQTKFYVYKKNGSIVEFPISEVDSINIDKKSPDLVYEYVDLGLPSGTLWATFNVGAAKPEEYGDYFAWGETVPKDKYDWRSYKLLVYDDEKGIDHFTKYITESLYGEVDFKLTLDPKDDAATVNWGEEWRMPTKEEQVELINECVWTWSSIKGVNGYEIKGQNGNTIFLPTAGAYGSNLYLDGGYGWYWSSSLCVYSSNCAYYIVYDKDSYSISYFDRGRGFSVRPVYANKKK